MAVPGALHGTQITPQSALGALVANSTLSTYAMASQNAGYAVVFVAQSTKDVKSVRIRWSSVSSAGVVQLRVETVDATSGKPTGNLYDANATFDITPAAGVQTYSFSTTPTTGLVAGTQYAIVLLTTTGGTTHTLEAYLTSASHSYSVVSVLTAADATTRSNFAITVGAMPVLSLVMDDDTEECVQFFPFYGSANTNGIYGTVGVCQEIVLPVDVVCSGAVAFTTKAGTPAGDLRVRIFTSGGSAVSGAERTHDKDTIALSATARRSVFTFDTPVTLVAGTYRIVFDSASSADSSNCHRLHSYSFLNAACAPSGFITKTTADVTASPVTWSAATGLAFAGLMIDSFPAPDFPAAGNVTEDDTTNGVTGTYHEPTVAEVQSGVQFGAAGTEYTGTYSAGGSGGGPIMGGTVVR